MAAAVKIKVGNDPYRGDSDSLQRHSGHSEGWIPMFIQFIQFHCISWPMICLRIQWWQRIRRRNLVHGSSQKKNCESWCEIVCSIDIDIESWYDMLFNDLRMPEQSLRWSLTLENCSSMPQSDWYLIVLCPGLASQAHSIFAWQHTAGCIMENKWPLNMYHAFLNMAALKKQVMDNDTKLKYASIHR